MHPAIIPTMNPELYKAATSGNGEHVAYTNVQLEKAPQENTALHIAAKFGHADFTKKILERCSQLICMKNSNEDTALHCAARAGCLEVAKVLVDYVEVEGSSVGLLRMQNKEGDTALHEALKNRQKDMAIMMLRADPKLPSVVNNANESSLLLAAKEKMEAVVKEILLTDPSDNSGEQQAAANAISEISSDIVIPLNAQSKLTEEEKRELIKIQDNTGRTALHYAAWRNNANIVHMIMMTNHRRVLYIADNNGHSPLHVAVAFGMQDSMLELLKHCPDAIEQLDAGGRNVLHIALLNGRHKIITKLLGLPHIKGLLNVPDKEGNIPIFLGWKEYIGTLLTGKRAEPTLRNKDGQRPSYLMHFPALGLPQHMPPVIPIKKPKKEGSGASNHGVFLVTASLVATVTFAAAFTLPGGYRSSNEANPGTAVLASRAPFKAFLLLDTFAMCLSIAAIFLYIFGLGVAQTQGCRPNFGGWLLVAGNIITCIACLCMLLALSAAMFLVVEAESKWLAKAVVAISSLVPGLFVAVFVAVFGPLISMIIVIPTVILLCVTLGIPLVCFYWIQMLRRGFLACRNQPEGQVAV